MADSILVRQQAVRRAISHGEGMVRVVVRKQALPAEGQPLFFFLFFSLPSLPPTLLRSIELTDVN